MLPYVLIAGYVTVWVAWSLLVAATRLCRGDSGEPVSFGRFASIVGWALVPMVALAVVAQRTPWIPGPVNPMLTLMTPILTALFVSTQWTRSGSSSRPSRERGDAGGKRRYPER